MKKLEKNETLALSFIALNIADYYTTKKILKIGGKELNPIVRIAIKFKCFGLAKTVITMLGALSIYSEKNPHPSSKSLVGLYSLAVSNNIIQILKNNLNQKK